MVVVVSGLLRHFVPRNDDVCRRHCEGASPKQSGNHKNHVIRAGGNTIPYLPVYDFCYPAVAATDKEDALRETGGVDGVDARQDFRFVQFMAHD